MKRQALSFSFDSGPRIALRKLLELINRWMSKLTNPIRALMASRISSYTFADIRFTPPRRARRLISAFAVPWGKNFLVQFFEERGFWTVQLTYASDGVPNHFSVREGHHSSAMRCPIVFRERTPTKTRFFVWRKRVIKIGKNEHGEVCLPMPPHPSTANPTANLTP